MLRARSGIGRIRTDIAAVQAQHSAIELRPLEVGTAGLEPAASRSQAGRSGQLSYTPKLALVAGFEPATSCLTGRHSSTELHQSDKPIDDGSKI